MEKLPELIHINTNSEQITLSARELHDKLEIQTDFPHWFPRMCEYGFEDGKDYRTFLTDRADGLPGKPKQDAEITIDMAKQICMIQRTDIGRQYREYFLQLEKEWNSPEKVMARALSIARKQLESIQGDVKRLESENSALAVQNEIYRPKAEYFDELVDRKLLTNFTDTAKELGVKRKKFIQFLLEHKYIYRDKAGNLKPYAQYADTDDGAGLFHIKECVNEKTEWSGAQTLVTVKGKETFRLLIAEA